MPEHGYNFYLWELISAEHKKIKFVSADQRVIFCLLYTHHWNTRPVTMTSTLISIPWLKTEIVDLHWIPDFCHSRNSGISSVSINNINYNPFLFISKIAILKNE